MSYLWIKVLHLLAVMTWMAGIFYVFRLLAYHAKHRAEPASVTLLVEMERKMLRIVMLPGALASIALGVLMLWMNPSLLSHRWLHVKLAAVLGMVAYQWYAERAVARFRGGDFFLSEIQSRALHLVPTVLLVIIIAMAVLQSALVN